MTDAKREPQWYDLGPAEALARTPLQEIKIERHTIALSCVDGEWGAVSGHCNHVGGPLGHGTLDADGYIVCPWHHWKFHRATGLGEPGYEEDRVPRYTLELRDGHVLVDLASATPRHRVGHAPHPLARPVERAPGPVRIAGLSTTSMDLEHPRYSTSDALLDEALRHAGKDLGKETRLLRLAALKFRACEGYYSKSARACTWPCSITQMDRHDEMEQVYEAFVHWADVVIVATPIRWGAASSLYYRMVERMNCIQNQVTLADRVLLRNKVVGLIITGGQDNIQAVAGQMLGFFGEIGCVFPQFPYIANSRGWSHEDMENNVREVRESEDLREGTRELVRRSVEMAETLLAGELTDVKVARGGRKAQPERPHHRVK
jgi:multimeric flavodoxin WrbA/nitrite reductase/ring-hydroxylating ferredoxin subunit